MMYQILHKLRSKCFQIFVILSVLKVSQVKDCDGNIIQYNIVNFRKKIAMRRRNSGVENQNPNIHPNFGSTYRVEADQKEVIIGKLRSEVESLKKNQQQFYLMKDQYAELDRKYRSQLDQKNVQDAEFKTKHQSALRHIGQLKNQVEAIKAELRDKKIQINDLQTDSETLKNTLDQRNIEIDKHRGDVNSLAADSEELEGQRRALTQQLENTRKQNSSLKEEYIGLDRENGSVKQRLAQMEKYFQQLQMQAGLLKEKIKDYEHQNNELDGIIQGVIDDVSELENFIYESQADIAHLQALNATTSANADQYRSEAIHNQKAAQAQTMKNNDLSKTIKQAENMLKVRASQVEEGRSEIHALRGENQSLERINAQLEEDLEACRKHLEDLGLLNHQLISSLESFSQEDRTVSQLIDRRPRVTYMRERVSETSLIDYRSGKDTGRTQASTRRGQRY